MATQYLTLSIVGCETSSQEIRELILGNEVVELSGTVNTKYRDYSAEDILIELHDAGVQNVEKAEHLEDDGASMIYVKMFVTDEQAQRLSLWIEENKDESLQDFTWGVSIGDRVDVDGNYDGLNIEFRGTAIGFKCPWVQMRDMDDDVLDIHPDDITTAE
jgi:hypothetical protein